MPFIQTCLDQSESASPKATTLCVYNMSLFLVACLQNRWQRASSARCLQTNKARGLTTPRSSKPLFPDLFDIIATEIEVDQLPALSQHCCKALWSGCSEIRIAAEIKVLQRWACASTPASLFTARPFISQVRQHSCKPLYGSSFHFFGCVCVDCLAVRVLFFCAARCLPSSVAPFSPACLAADISLRRSDFLCVWPHECNSPRFRVVCLHSVGFGGS
jgi:hypothetical protein